MTSTPRAFGLNSSFDVLANICMSALELFESRPATAIVHPTKSERLVSMIVRANRLAASTYYRRGGSSRSSRLLLDLISGGNYFVVALATIHNRHTHRALTTARRRARARQKRQYRQWQIEEKLFAELKRWTRRSAASRLISRAVKDWRFTLHA